MARMARIYPLHIVTHGSPGSGSGSQAEVLDHLIEENRLLKEQLKGDGSD